MYRIVSAFKSKPTATGTYSSTSNTEPSTATKQKEATKRSLENEGDFIDYEEIK